jgi:hypothetical protein
VIQDHYRADYAGEFVVLETKWAGGQKQQTREWVPNPIENQHISGRAACIGSDLDRQQFDYARLQRHRGGLLGSKKLQTYGVGSIAHTMKLDFTVETNHSQLEQFVADNHGEHNIVYTSARNCVTYPENFYLIPYNPKLLDISTIVYMAAFDEHKEIFLLGYNKDTPIERPNWYQELPEIFKAYAATRFYFVGESSNMFEEWFDFVNVGSMKYREFITYCDI